LILYSEATRTGRIDKNRIQESIALLEEGLETNVLAYLRLNAYFWLGRMYEELGNRRSKDYFAMAIKGNRYGYYGIRSQIHLNANGEARELLWADPASKRLWRQQYQNALSAASTLQGEIDSPYYRRLRGALETGLYELLLGLESLKRKDDERIEALPLGKLDRDGSLTYLSILLALRQDVWQAAHDAPDLSGRLAVAHLIKNVDTFLGLRVVNYRAPAIQSEPTYLSVAYPLVYADELRATASSTEQVRPELLYALMRHESLFYSSAFSRNEAIGLFQFIPSTFDKLDNEWQLLATAKVRNRELYLLDAQRNIALGARWAERLLNAHGNEPLWALMNHNAPDDKVREWKRILAAEEKQNDVEYAIETIDYAQTRSFLRDVIANMIIVDALDLYKEQRSSSQ
jgi:hypothetical protein